MKLWLMLIMLALLPIPLYAATDADFTNAEIVIAPRPHQDLAGYPLDMSDDYYFVKSASRIFFQAVPLTAKITNADISSDKAEFTLRSSKFGEGTITIFSAKDFTQASPHLIAEVLSKSLTDEKISLVVGDTSTKTFHVATANHLPPEGHRCYFQHSTALEKGFRRCGVCFSKRLYTPDYAVELMLQKKAEAELRHFNQDIVDTALEARVDRIGNKVLSHWPYPLIGYAYSFKVLQSEEINAFALAAGAIFLTSGLIDAAANDDELEAVLAHEIAHVERQHVLQSYKKAVASQQTQTALQLLGGIAAGVAVANNRTSAAGVIGGVTLASIVAVQLSEIGYSKEHEKEADAFAIRYFNNAGMSLAPLKSMFKKLMYHNLCSRSTPDPPSLSHPALGRRLAVLETEKTIFPHAKYHLNVKDHPLEMHVLSSSSTDDGAEMVLYISDFDTFNNLTSGLNTFTLNSGAKSLRLTVEGEYIYSDAWGGTVNVRAKEPLPTVPIFDSVGELTYVNMNSGKISTMQDPNAYPEMRKQPLSIGSVY